MNRKIFFVFLCSLFLNIFSFANELPYNFESTKSIPIKLVITEEISTKDDLVEGKKINFRVLNTVFYKKKIILKAGDIIPARIETVLASGMNGFPAEIIVDNFEFKDIKKSQLLSEYNDKGFNRCYFVYPLKWALTPIPGAGTLTNFIKGGHAKIKTDEVVTLRYFPQWK